MWELVYIVLLDLDYCRDKSQNSLDGMGFMATAGVREINIRTASRALGALFSSTFLY